ncbi:MAG: hypothetical protein NUW24_14805 [Anaerolineae bacterium]|jgi:Flp pilus assembly pilin Flp|nr:hypothetical protein [Anaerolineae bacterium]MDH7475042.1 hypothetical protein [Anaerolineae bacterium]
MNEQRTHEKGQGLIELALMLLLISVVTGGVLVAMGPQVGGVFSEAHAAISGVIAPPVVSTPVALDTPTPTATSTPSPATPTPTPTLPPLPPAGTPVIVPTVPTFPPTATPTPTPVPTATPVVQCPGFDFSGRLTLLDGDRDKFDETLVFDWAYVLVASPYELDSPIAKEGGYMSWYFVSLGPVRLTGRYTEFGEGIEFEVDPTPVSLQIAPLGGAPVLAGKVSFKQLWVSDRQASLNREQAVNVSGIQVTNMKASPILRAFEGQDQGVLTIEIQSPSELAKHILKGNGVRVSYKATMRPALCR